MPTQRIREAFGGPLAVPARPAAGAVTLRADTVAVRRGTREVLRDISFEVIAGEVVALVGPNGAGKSTLLAALSGAAPVSAGTVTLEGRPLSDWTPVQTALRRAVLPQSHSVAFAFTALEVVRMGRAPWARTAAVAADDEHVAEAMAVCDVTDLAERPFPELSGGERARVALARVLAQDTATLLLDEPTAALDLGHQETVMRVARERARAGAAVVVVLHDLGLAAAYADRVAVLDAGRLVAVGPPREVLTAERLSQVYDHPVEVFDHPVSGQQLVLPHRATGGSAPPHS